MELIVKSEEQTTKLFTNPFHWRILIHWDRRSQIRSSCGLNRSREKFLSFHRAFNKQKRWFIPLHWIISFFSLTSRTRRHFVFLIILRMPEMRFSRLLPLVSWKWALVKDHFRLFHHVVCVFLSLHYLQASCHKRQETWSNILLCSSPDPTVHTWRSLCPERLLGGKVLCCCCARQEAKRGTIFLYITLCSSFIKRRIRNLLMSKWLTLAISIRNVLKHSTNRTTEFHVTSLPPCWRASSGK